MWRLCRIAPHCVKTGIWLNCLQGRNFALFLKSIIFWDMTPCSPLSQRTVRRHIPEDVTLHNHRCENVKSYIRFILLHVSVLKYVILSFLCHIFKMSSILGVGWDWVHLVRRPLMGLLYQPPHDKWVWSVYKYKNWKGKPKSSEKPPAVPFCEPQIPRDLN
jgi:hypothetical protein